MRNHPLTGFLALAAIVGGPALVIGLISQPAQGQPGETPPPLASLPGGPDSPYIGPITCSSCHLAGKTVLNPLYQRQGSYDFCRMDESKVWFEEDMHAIAFEALGTDLGKQMGELLDTDVTKDVRCLTCHALDLYPDKPLAEKKVEAFDTTNGVSCEGCHGPGKEWGLAHIDATRWRYQTADWKLERGMADLRHPVNRAAKCASCHVGNVAEGKFVTHEMYAAGHPPLPGFEILTFSQDEPAHWMLKAETPVITKFAEEEPDKSWDVFRYRKGENEQARLLAVGALVAFRESMRALADEAKDPGAGIIDFAYFDCYACHHDLEYPGWRQKRGYPGVPGRPTLRAWPVEMTRLVIGHAKDDEAVANLGTGLEPALKALNLSLDGRPFGDPVEVAEAASTLAEWSDQVAQKIATYSYTSEETDQLVQAIIEAGKSVPTDPSKGRIDYEAAQQLGCAFNVLTKGYDDQRDPKLEAAIEELSKVVLLNFREEGKRRFIAERLEPRLQQLYDFRPETFRNVFLKIDQALGGQ